MLVTDKIQELEALVNYEFDSDVKIKLKNPYDFRRAVEYAIRMMCSKCEIIERTAFLPFISGKQQFNVALDTYEKRD